MEMEIQKKCSNLKTKQNIKYYDFYYNFMFEKKTRNIEDK